MLEPPGFATVEWVMLDPLIILAALACGMASRAVGLPALIGYLAAGFILHGMELRGGEILFVLSDMGITLLLFTIGLKLQPVALLKPQIWGTTLIHMALMQLLFMAVLYLLNLVVPSIGLDLTATLVITFALTFSSTVFVIQMMIMLALTNHQENILVSKLLAELGYSGHIAAEATELEQQGISMFNLYAQAGAGFASHATKTLIKS